MNEFKSDKPKTTDKNLLDEAFSQIVSEDYMQALSYLQSCESFLDTTQKSSKSFMKLTVFHNSAVCLSRLGRIKLSIEYLESALLLVKKILKASDNSVESLKILKYISKLQLQICALASQSKQHQKALKYAKDSLKYIKEMFSTLSILVSQLSIVKKNRKSATKYIDTVSKVTVVLDKIISKRFEKRVKLYIEEEWLDHYNIGNLMILQPISMSEWITPDTLQHHLKSDKVLENICMLACCYFCISAEIRFIANPNDFLLSKEWHDKAISICKCFLPASCPLFMHILKSHKKHYNGKIEGKEKSVTPGKRIYSKRQSEKPRASSVKKTGSMPKTPAKTTTPLRKMPSKQKISTKNLGNTARISTRDLLIANCTKRITNRETSQSEATLKQRMMKTQKYIRPDLSDDSENSSEECKKFIPTSNDLYGEYSIKDDQDPSIIIKTSRKGLDLHKDEIETVLRPEYKSRIMSSTGGKN